MQIFRRLRDEHAYRGGYDQVRRYVGRHRRDHRETFIPLAHDPGQRLEADFGHIHVDFPDGRRLVPVLVAAWAYSNYPFALALPTERTEAILAGMVAGLHVLRLRAARGLVGQPQDGGPADLHRAVSGGPTTATQALASHYTFEPLFCMPARGNEKPHAENARPGVAAAVGHAGAAGRRPGRARTLTCGSAAWRSRAARWPATTESIGQRFARDRARALPLPAHRLRRLHPAGGPGGQVPDGALRPQPLQRAAGVRLPGGDGQGLRRPRRGGRRRPGGGAARRSYGRDEQILDPLHYLATLGRRPAALDHAPVLRDWQLPESFAQLRQALEQRHGPTAGARQYIRVLQLLAEHPLERVQQAVEACMSPERSRTPSASPALVQRLADAGRGRAACPW